MGSISCLDGSIAELQLKPLTSQRCGLGLYCTNKHSHTIHTKEEDHQTQGRKEIGKRAELQPGLLENIKFVKLTQPHHL